jgi:hypothetical protein
VAAGICLASTAYSLQAVSSTCTREASSTILATTALSDPNSGTKSRCMTRGAPRAIISAGFPSIVFILTELPIPFRFELS